MERNLSVCYFLLVVSLMIATASLVLSILTITRPNMANSGLAMIDLKSAMSGQDSSTQSTAGSDGELNGYRRVYTFAYDVPWEEYQYLSRDGQLRGLSIDLITAVCREAKVTCRHAVTPIKYCWNSDEAIGEGLLGRWFDACAVYLKTSTRDNIFRFSGSFYQPKFAQFYVKSSSTIDPENLENTAIAAKAGWYIGKECLIRIGANKRNIIQGANKAELTALLQNDTVEAVLVEEGSLDGTMNFKSISQTYDCSLGGSGVMHRVDSDIPNWFNPAYEEIRKRGIFREICQGYKNLSSTCL